MPSGGPRPGSGRKPGSVNALTKALAAAVQAAGGDDLAAALAVVSEDPRFGRDVRLEAARRLCGILVGRVYVSTLPAAVPEITEGGAA